MKTERLKADEQGIARAGELLREGKLVAIPTETVYGLAANALDSGAVAKIFAAKGRPMDNPLIVHIAQLEDVLPLVREFPAQARALAEAYWPGPMTMILPKADCIPEEVSAGLSTVAVRFPSHPAAQAIIRAAGVPLAAPSANSSGKPSPTCAEHVLLDMDGKIDAVLDGGDCGVGVESTVVTLTSERPLLLRPGGITPEQLHAVLGDLEIDPAVTHRLAEGQQAISPGMKYKHYAPAADVTILRGTRQAYLDYVNAHAQPGVFALCFEEDEPALRVPFVCYGREEDSSSQAHLLFDALRLLDERGAKKVFARCPSQQGVGLAVYNRLIRAAGFSFLDV